MARAAEIAALRALGLSLAQVARVLGRDPLGLEPALAAHQATLEGRVRQFAGAVEKVRGLRADLARGQAPAAGELARLLEPTAVAFDLPWPWGGERFEQRDVRPLNYIIGPLGSDKTRLAQRLAETLLDAAFLGLERCSPAPARSWTWSPWAPTRRSSSAPPITARRPASPPIPALRASRPSPPASPRPKCGHGRKASSRGAAPSDDLNLRSSHVPRARCFVIKTRSGTATVSEARSRLRWRASRSATPSFDRRDRGAA